MFSRLPCFLRRICQRIALGKYVSGLLGMAGKRFTLTDDESLTLKRVLEFHIAQIDRQMHSTNPTYLHIHALNLLHEKTARIYAKLFPNAISKNKNP